MRKVGTNGNPRFKLPAKEEKQTGNTLAAEDIANFFAGSFSEVLLQVIVSEAYCSR